ncbi:MAG: cytochrome C oxidase subunit IV family protein [Flavobacteriales bacterium]|nr:cytochrome C oxidase subunit IV family protein [Flavobacteriales bacterium]
MERDDLIVNDQYSVDAHHSEEDGKKIRANIWKVTGILTALTAVEVWMGIQFGSAFGLTWQVVKWIFIILTVFKAGFIVMVFMHLGDERSNLKWTILAPYILFILYLVFICLTESSALGDLRNILDWIRG